MLASLQIRNFAIIDEVEVDFGPGMTVLTGETGAGKSILVDALGLVLGERGGSGLVRADSKRAEFTAEFDLKNLPAARHWLEEQMLDLDDECNLRRVIGADGRSRAFINGNNVPLQSLKTLGEMLLDIHGQHFHQSLGRRNVQRDLLDYFGGLVDLAVATGNAYREWQRVAAQLETLQSANQDRAEKLELLRFQISELDALDADADEFTALLAEQARLQNSGRIAEGVGNALQTLYDADAGNVQSMLAEATRTIESLSAVDAKLEPVTAMLAEANIQVSEATDQLRRYGDALDMDPARQDWVEQRLDALYSIARKHRVEPDALSTVHATLQAQFDDLEHAEERGVELAAEVSVAEAAYRQSAERLSAGRQKAASKFSLDVTNAMHDLGMPGGSFEVKVAPMTDAKAWGIDAVEFLITANPGQPLQALSKVASGGELSRMSLAIQVIASDGSSIPTMVFDEVDSGVGGGVAEMVGKRLRELGRSRQVFCVTHLPQVASLGDNHFRIMKVSDGKSTRTAVTLLNQDERTEEIARMLGGVEITKRTREHAAEMLKLGARKAPRKKRA